MLAISKQRSSSMQLPNKLMPILNTLRQKAWIPFAALAVAFLLAHLPFTDRLERIVGDAQESLVSRPAYFSDAVVIDIDEASLRALKPYLGSWPYERDIYALLLDYLNEHGAAAVVFDVLMADERNGDKAFAQSLQKNGNGILSAVASSSEVRMTQRDIALLDGLRQPPTANLPRVPWPTLLLPNSRLLGDPGVIVGVAAAIPDPDGVLRRIPLAHEANGVALPSLLLAALEVGGRRDKAGGKVGSHAGNSDAWKVDRQGFVHLYFPANANSVMKMSFQQVAEAALGVANLRNASDFFRGKTVFIGSTAYLSDRVMTPRGAMAGTYLLAVAHQSLQQGLAWLPPSFAWNGLLVVLSFVAVVCLMIPFDQTWRTTLVWAVASVTTLWLVHLSLLYFAMQQSAIMTPLLVLLVGWATHAAYEYARLRQRAMDAEAEADLDSLTGLMIRRALVRSFRRDLASARRHNRPLTVAVLDLDHFKSVNDTYGHMMGDMVLKTFAEVMRQSLRGSDLAGRWGGEEFVIVLPDTDAAGALIVLEKIRRAIWEERFPTPAHSLSVTMSAGVAQYVGGNTSVEDLIHAADTALYEAKESGRNRIRISNSSRNSRSWPESAGHGQQGADTAVMVRGKEEAQNTDA